MAKMNKNSRLFPFSDYKNFGVGFVFTKSYIKKFKLILELQFGFWNLWIGI